MNGTKFLWAIVMSATTIPAFAAEEVPLIPRDVLFGNPDKAGVRISLDGKHLSWLAPVNGVLNVWVAPVDDLNAAKPITKDTKRGIRSQSWTYDNKHLVYLQDENGDENWHVYSVNIETGATVDLTPVKGIAAQIDKASEKFPGQLIVGINDRNPQLHDLYKVDVATGKRELLFENPGYAGVMVDDDFVVQFGIKFSLTDGSLQVFRRDEKGEFVPFESIPMEDTMTTRPVEFTKDGKSAYLLDSRGRNTAALVKMDLATKKTEVIASDDKADINEILMHPTKKTIQAAAGEYERVRWQFFDPEVKKDFEILAKVAKGDIGITSGTLDDRIWIVGFVPDDGPVKSYLYNRDTKEAKFLFTNRKDLESVKLAKMEPVLIPARDGLELVSYLTLPVGTREGDGIAPKKPLPMVLYVHGGPWARDQWGLNPVHQWLANRGYAVLSVNFRGSTGFGKKFINAGNREWGAKMHDDLLDSVKWAIDNKIADPAKIAIMGGSYGGYATLAGLTLTPDVFACGVDIVGPSNLVTLLKSLPPYWLPQLRMFKDRVGDHTTEEGKKFLESRSPLTFTENIKKPLLIGQGANDPRVKQAESDQIVQAMISKQIPVTYVLYPDEGHGFARPENRLSFFAIAEGFLSEHLGGRFEPIGESFKGSSVSVPQGAKEVPGLSESISAGGK